MRECLEEGIIQGYADGELSLEMMEAAAAHIKSCAACAVAVREAEDETAILSSAFAPELSLSVPTARLRERLDAAIADLQPQTPLVMENSGSRLLRDWLGSLFAPFAFAPRQAMGFASLAVLLAFAAIFSALYLKNSGPEYAREVKSGAPVAFTIPEARMKETVVPESGTTGAGQERVIAVKNAVKRVRPRVQANREEALPLVAKSPAPKQPAAAPVKDALLPGERSYLTAIASLTTNLEAGGEMSLKPSLRAEYERNLAVVDQAIEATRRAARSDPNDDDAASFLLTAYQSKVDLLNTVADQARLSASAR
ncbi:MAG: zf-HC2 domain-containing protein [Pyrinomonadaceae bacterium]